MARMPPFAGLFFYNNRSLYQGHVRHYRHLPDLVPESSPCPSIVQRFLSAILGI